MSTVGCVRRVLERVDVVIHTLAFTLIAPIVLPRHPAMPGSCSIRLAGHSSHP